jgi:hypothetical protein
MALFLHVQHNRQGLWHFSATNLTTSPTRANEFPPQDWQVLEENIGYVLILGGIPVPARPPDSVTVLLDSQLYFFLVILLAQRGAGSILAFKPVELSENRLSFWNLPTP